MYPDVSGALFCAPKKNVIAPSPELKSLKNAFGTVTVLTTLPLIDNVSTTARDAIKIWESTEARIWYQEVEEAISKPPDIVVSAARPLAYKYAVGAIAVVDTWYSLMVNCRTPLTMHREINCVVLMIFDSRQEGPVTVFGLIHNSAMNDPGRITSRVSVDELGS